MVSKLTCFPIQNYCSYIKAMARGYIISILILLHICLCHAAIIRSHSSGLRMTIVDPIDDYCPAGMLRGSELNE